MDIVIDDHEDGDKRCPQGCPQPLHENEVSLPPMRAGIGVLLFLLITVIASLPRAQHLDRVVTTWLQGAAPAVDWPASILVFLGDAEVLFTAAVLAGLIFFSRDRPRGIAALQLAAGLATVSILAVLLKYAIPHLGPPLSRAHHILGFRIPPSSSLPSGHTMRATFIAGTVLRHHPVVAGSLVLCMMAALVYLGDHWTTDVLAGLCLGWACAEIALGFAHDPPAPRA
jgi:membrane-associated phospholipid phosphatase